MINKVQSNVNFGALKINYKTLEKQLNNATKLEEIKNLEKEFSKTIDELDKAGYDLSIKGKFGIITWGSTHKSTKSVARSPQSALSEHASPLTMFNDMFLDSLSHLNDRISYALKHLKKGP